MPTMTCLCSNALIIIAFCFFHGLACDRRYWLSRTNGQQHTDSDWARVDYSFREYRQLAWLRQRVLLHADETQINMCCGCCCARPSELQSNMSNVKQSALSRPASPAIQRSNVWRNQNTLALHGSTSCVLPVCTIVEHTLHNKAGTTFKSVDLLWMPFYEVHRDIKVKDIE